MAILALLRSTLVAAQEAAARSAQPSLSARKVQATASLSEYKDQKSTLIFRRFFFRTTLHSQANSDFGSERANIVIIDKTELSHVYNMNPASQQVRLANFQRFSWWLEVVILL